MTYMNCVTQKLIKRLYAQHIKYNESLPMDKYATEGEEDFATWLQLCLSEYDKNWEWLR